MTITTQSSNSSKSVCNVIHSVQDFFLQINDGSIDDSIKEIIFKKMVEPASLCNISSINTSKSFSKVNGSDKKIGLLALLILPISFCFYYIFCCRKKKSGEDMESLVTKEY